MKWHDQVSKAYGQKIFAQFDILLPNEFATLKDSEKDSYNNQVNELLRGLNLKNKSKNEDVIAESGVDDFVTGDDWDMMNSEESFMLSSQQYKMFSGKNYSLEFHRSDNDVFLHLYYPDGKIQKNNEVIDTLILLMEPIVPRQWRVTLSFQNDVMPHTQKPSSDKLGDYPTSSSYTILFNNAIEELNSHFFIEKVIKKILSKFIMPKHFMQGMG